ncbi:MAG: glycosyltransferase, partial [Candidatus Acidiferrum sp.]
VARKGLQDVRFTGRLTRNEALAAMKKAAFLVVPSVWYEAFGLVVAEAFACGTPVLGASVGAIREMLDDHMTGLQFAPDDSEGLAIKVAWAWQHSAQLEAMGRAGRRVYEDRYSAEVNYKLLMNIYDSAVEAHGRRKESWRHRNAA